MSRPLIGISSCLLGEKVRYNAEHKYDQWIAESLSEYVDFFPLCPEISMGLGVPRETLNLKRLDKKSDVHMISASGIDRTELALKTAKKMLSKIPELDGYIFKSRSPSCGLEKVKVYDWNGSPSGDGIGLFAKQMKANFPLLPMIEEGRLNNLDYREHFVTQIFSRHSLRQLTSKTSVLQDFHRRNKLLIMTYKNSEYLKLGKIAANSQKAPPSQVLKLYQDAFMAALQKVPSRKSRTNVLQHAYGFLKNKLNPLEKKRLLETIEDYRQERIPFIAALIFLNHFIEYYSAEYLKDQTFFAPHPKALLLHKGIS